MNEVDPVVYGRAVSAARAGIVAGVVAALAVAIHVVARVGAAVTGACAARSEGARDE